MACTTLLVGKNAAFDGSTMVARNEDSGAGAYNAKKFIVVSSEEQPRVYTSVISKVKIELPDNPMRYTAMPNATDEEGIWAAAGVNEMNVAMSATETITSNPRVLAADPLVVYQPAKDGSAEVPGGIGEEDIVTITLPYIHSAREGVERLGYLHETYGTYEMNGIAVHDTDEIWWFETIGGHHWMARRVPDDAYVVMPNQLGIDYFDFADAYGEKKEYMCSADLKEFVEKNHLSLCDETFDPRAAFGSHSDSDYSYNTPRAWWMERYLNPSMKWEGSDAAYTPESNNLPWCLVPERKITIEDAKYVLSGHYQGTPYDCYGKYGDAKERGRYRPIGINRNNFLSLTQLRPNVEKPYMALEWITFGSNVFNAFIPQFADVDDTPAYFRDTNGTVSTDSFYWVNRLIGALADAEFSECNALIERYANKLAVLTYRMIMDCENNCGNKEETNEKIADIVKLESEKLLHEILDIRSNHMRNGYSRSDA